MKTHITFYTSFILLIFILTGCKKLIEVDPPVERVIGQEIYKTNSGAASVLTGIYSDMSKDGIGKGRRSIGVLTGLYADELDLFPVVTDILSVLYANNLTNVEPGLWNELYKYLFRVNAAIGGIHASSGISEPVRNQLMGEAKFLRGFLFLYLVQIYGDVPLVLSTDLAVNATLPRAPVQSVYDQIKADLKEAQQLLNENYLTGDVTTITTERLRPNKSTAAALLARLSLYSGDWQAAEQYATTVINETGRYVLTNDLLDVFPASSLETIWAIQPVEMFGPSKTDAGFYILTNGLTFSQPVSLSDTLLNSFEPGDLRRSMWIGSYISGPEAACYPYKYRDLSDGLAYAEYTVVVRLAEQYLIRAEARAHSGLISGANSAEADLNVIRSRAGLPSLTLTDMEQALSAILAERQHELFCEWGHRWFDLKRSGKVDEVMSVISPLKGGSWSSFETLFPIPVQDLQRNSGMRGHQNPGYPEQ